MADLSKVAELVRNSVLGLGSQVPSVTPSSLRLAPRGSCPSCGQERSACAYDSLNPPPRSLGSGRCTRSLAFKGILQTSILGHSQLPLLLVSSKYIHLLSKHVHIYDEHVISRCSDPPRLQEGVSVYMLRCLITFREANLNVPTKCYVPAK